MPKVQRLRGVLLRPATQRLHRSAPKAKTGLMLIDLAVLPEPSILFLCGTRTTQMRLSSRLKYKMRFKKIINLNRIVFINIRQHGSSACEGGGLTTVQRPPQGASAAPRRGCSTSAWLPDCLAVWQAACLAALLAAWLLAYNGKFES